MLGYVLVGMGLILGFATGGSMAQVAGYFVEGLLDWSTIQLLGVVTIIEMLTIFLQSTGSLDRILVALRGVFQDSKVLIGLVPSVLGLFPVPGGAVLSAPMVGTYGDEIGLGADDKAATNLFFRHIWDQVFPFKPHLILAATVVNIPLFTLIGWHLPITLASVAFGHWQLVARRAKPQAVHEVKASNPGAGHPLWVEVAPLVIPLLLALIFKIDFLYAMLAGLLFGLATQRVSRGMLRKMVAKGIHPKPLFTLAAVMIFKTVVDDSGVVKTIATLLSGYGVPVILLAVALPLIVGMATGIEAAVVAICFPLLLGMIADSWIIPYLLIMMVAGSTGSTLSPVHVCVVAGNEYYGATLSRMTRIISPPFIFRLAATLVFAWAVAMYWPK